MTAAVVMLAVTVVLLATALGWSMRRTRTAKAGRTEAEQEARNLEAELADHRDGSEVAARYYDEALNTLRGQLADTEDELAWARMTVAAVAQHCGDEPIHRAVTADLPPSDLGKRRAAKAKPRVVRS